MIVFLLTLLMMDVNAVANDSSIGIMTFNIRFGKMDSDYDGLNSWRYRRSQLFEVVNKYHPVVMGIQEGLADQLADIHQNLQGSYERYGLPREENDEYVQIFYDNSIVQRLDGGNFWLSRTPDTPGGPPAWGANNVRMTTWCKFQMRSTEQEFYVFNTHLDHISEKARHKSASLLRRRMDAIAGSSPVILMGDFNTYRFTSTFNRLTTLGGGLSDAWLTAESKTGDVAFTYHGWIGKRCEDGQPPGKYHIDWLLYQPHEMRVTSTEVITERREGDFYPSDHYPIYSTFILPL